MEHQPVMTPSYYYATGSGDEAPLPVGAVDEYGANVNVGYAQIYHHAPPPAQLDINQMRPTMQMQMQPQYMAQHPQQMAIVAPSVQYDPTRNGIYHQSVTSPPPPQSPFDPISPAHSLSDHSASGTESVGRGGGVPGMVHPRLGYHSHSHSLSSASSSSGHEGVSHSEPHYSNMSYHNDQTPNRKRNRRIAVEPGTPPSGGIGGPGMLSDDERDDPFQNQVNLMNRKESTRRQRIQAEQRRRDELRDGYARLKDVLPISSSKSSKVSLIERARSHILDMDAENAMLKSKVEELQKEVQRLREIGDQMAMKVTAPFNSTGATAPLNTGLTMHVSESPEEDSKDVFGLNNNATPMQGNTPQFGDDSPSEGVHVEPAVVATAF